MCSPHCHTSRSVVGSIILIPTVRRAWCEDLTQARAFHASSPRSRTCQSPSARPFSGPRDQKDRGHDKSPGSRCQALSMESLERIHWCSAWSHRVHWPKVKFAYVDECAITKARAAEFRGGWGGRARLSPLGAWRGRSLGARAASSVERSKLQNMLTRPGSEGAQPCVLPDGRKLRTDRQSGSLRGSACEWNGSTIAPLHAARGATSEYCVRSAARGARSSRRAPEHLMARARAEPLAQFGVRRERRILVGEDRPPVDRPPNVVHRQNVQENTVQSQPKAAHTGTSATSCKSYHRFG